MTAAASAVVICLGCSLGFAGCAGQTAQHEANVEQMKDIIVNSQGFNVGSEGVTYAFTAMNPNEGHVANNITFMVEGYDSAGNMVMGSGQTISAIYPSTETPAAGTAQLFSKDVATPTLARISVKPVMSSVEWSATDLSNNDIDEMLEVDRTSMSEGADNLTNITAAVQTSYPNVEARAIALLYDADQNPICGSNIALFNVGIDVPKDESSASVRADSDKELAARTIHVSIENAPDFSSARIFITPVQV